MTKKKSFKVPKWLKLTKAKRRKLLKNLFHIGIVFFFTFVSWFFAEAGNTVLAPPWNTVFLFSRFFLEIDIISFGIIFFIYFRFINYFKAEHVVLLVALNITLLDIAIWFTFGSGEWFIQFLNWLISVFVAAMMIMIISVRFDQRKK